MPDKPDYSDAELATDDAAVISALILQNHIRLLSAGEWLFGSYSGTNQALQMVQAMTVLEILFGEESEETEKEQRKKDRQARTELGMTALLANRIAYLLGSNPSDRKRYEREFKSLYAVRSDVVHQGKRRLAEETELRRARELAKKAIRRELRFLQQEPF